MGHALSGSALRRNGLCPGPLEAPAWKSPARGAMETRLCNEHEGHTFGVTALRMLRAWLMALGM